MRSPTALVLLANVLVQVELFNLTFCAGNDVLHLLTSQKRYRLRIDMSNFNGDSIYAEYDSFVVDSMNGTYRLLILGSYSGNAGTVSLTSHAVSAHSEYL